MLVMGWAVPLSNWAALRLALTRLTVVLSSSYVPLPTCRKTRCDAAAMVSDQAWAAANCPRHSTTRPRAASRRGL
ncbi:hypothetical protein D9M69_718850 [compost metagenome]